MGLLDQLGAMMGGGQQMNAYAAGQPPVDFSTSPHDQNLQAMVRNAPPGALQQAFSQAARQMDPQEYSDHITPGVNGTNPLGGLLGSIMGGGGGGGAGRMGGGALGLIASTLMSKLMGSGASRQTLMSRVPGLQTSDPNQMSPEQVASLARYAQQNHPDAFGQAAAEVGQQRPDLLHSFLGKAGLAIGAAALASHFIKMDRQ